jgi:hypothetical protein
VAVEDRVDGDDGDRKISRIGLKGRGGGKRGGDGGVMGAAKPRRAEAGEAFGLAEAEDELAQAAPAGLGRAVGMMGLAARAEAVWSPPGDPRDHAGAQMDQEIELAVGVEQPGGETSAGGSVLAQAVAGVCVGEQGEAALEDVAQVRLHRRSRTMAPENPQNDPPERFHGRDNNPGPQPG